MMCTCGCVVAWLMAGLTLYYTTCIILCSLLKGERRATVTHSEPSDGLLFTCQACRPKQQSHRHIGK